MLNKFDPIKLAHALIHGTRISIIIYACILMVLGLNFLAQAPDYKCGVNLPPGLILFVCGLMLFHMKYHLKNRHNLRDTVSLIPASFMLWISVYMTGFSFISLDEGGFISTASPYSFYILFYDLLQILNFAFYLSILVSFIMTRMSSYPQKNITGGPTS